jgi:hypothetical protein
VAGMPRFVIAAPKSWGLAGLVDLRIGSLEGLVR